MYSPIFKRSAPAITLQARSSAPPQAETLVHASHALPRLARRLRAASSPRVLDMGAVVGSNLQFFIDLNCKVTADDFLRPVEAVIPDNGNGGGLDWKAPTARRLDYPDASFDAILCWDLFDLLGPKEAQVFSAEMRRLMKPGGIVMAYFTARQAESREPRRRFRILDQERIEWASLGQVRPTRHIYQNRDIERMFEGFKTLAATFLQNGVREILLEKKIPLSSPPPSSSPTPR